MQNLQGPSTLDCRFCNFDVSVLKNLARFRFRLPQYIVKCGAGHAWLASELLKVAGSIGANLEEGLAASSRRDMAAKYSISLRESREGHFWARLLATDSRWSTELQPIFLFSPAKSETIHPFSRP